MVALTTDPNAPLWLLNSEPNAPFAIVGWRLVVVEVTGCGGDGVEVAADGDDGGDVGGGDVVAGEGGYGVKGRRRGVAVGWWM
ncbi:hypothetical protein Tco_1186837 [Tanacetum coccineum]